MAKLSKNEEMLLIVIWRLKGEAYGVKIKKLIFEITAKNWNYGTMYCTLDQLVKKKFAFKSIGDPSPERGGRRKIYYKLTAEGINKLQVAFNIQKALWEGITELNLEKGTQVN